LKETNAKKQEDNKPEVKSSAADSIFDDKVIQSSKEPSEKEDEDCAVKNSLNISIPVSSYVKDDLSKKMDIKEEIKRDVILTSKANDSNDNY
jgi:hypothetical protein